jgi:mannitol/fructose-specific phosphotransferase system IIA component (Ntr-type)
MDTKPLLPKEHMVLAVSGETPRELLAALIEPLAAEGIVTSREEFLDALEAREQEVSTQVDGGVAFPHARSSAVKRLALTVGVAGPDGVRFSPETEESCRVFFLLAVPAVAPTAHLPLLRHLARFAHAPNKITRLLAAKTPGAAARVITTFRG